MTFEPTRPLVSYDPRAQAKREALAMRALVKPAPRGLAALWAYVRGAT